MDLTSAHFIKAARSGGGSAASDQCVECTFDFAAHGVVGVRDSKDAGGPVLAIPTGDWAAFLGVARAGGFRRRPNP